MLDVFFLTLLAVVLLAPPLILFRREEVLRWRTRYLLSVLPVAYTGLGWRLGILAYDFFGCQGGTKNVHACLMGGMDFTPLVGHGGFLMIPFVFIAVPLSLWLLLNTGAKQIGAWHRRNWPQDEHEES